MVWPLIAAGVSIFSQAQENNAKYKAQGQQSKALREANRINTDRTGFQVGLLQVQKGQRLKRLQQQRAQLGQDRLSASGAAANNAAAAGQVGASVAAVQLDIELQFERAKTQIEEQNEADAYNYNVELAQLIQAGQDALNTGVAPQGKSDLAIVGTAAAAAFSSYASGSMNLGLGTSGASAGRQVNLRS